MTQELGQDSGEKMLAGMLLHVVESASPVDPAHRPCSCEGRLQDVSDPIALVHHIRDLHPA
jgi:hypothetical protein